MSRPAAGQRLPARGQHVRPQPLQLGEVEPSRKQKDAAVPEILARGDIALGGLGIRLLDKLGDREGARRQPSSGSAASRCSRSRSRRAPG